MLQIGQELRVVASSYTPEFRKFDGLTHSWWWVKLPVKPTKTLDLQSWVSRVTHSPIGKSHSGCLLFRFVMNSFNSVTPEDETPKRRPVVRIVLAVSAVIAIFGMSVGAAQERDVAIAVAPEAALQVPTLALTDRDSNGPREIEGPSAEVLGLTEDLEESEQKVEVLEGQLSLLLQSQVATQLSIDAEAAEAAALGQSALVAEGRITDEQNEAALDLWRAGYTLGGGAELANFENIILPCESGNTPNPDTAVGRTDDWGRAQVNRPVWETRFESLTGFDFETGIVNPTLNGFMAAHIEQQQGLVAWTCWRNNGTSNGG